MFIAKMEGGLANQVFQWAMVKHLSVRYQVPFYLDLSYYDYQQDATPRSFSLHKFPQLNYETEIVLCAEDKPLKTVSDDFYYRGFYYDDKFNYYLEGYWQSEKYFKESAHIIKAELAAGKGLRESFAAISGGRKNVVSMHIRRTDYIRFSHIHPVLPLAYYQRALEMIGGYDCLLVFSDDIAWCKEHLFFERMIFVEGQDDVEDLWMMSFCNQHIIANSSFSWWGAWLNSNPFKKVIAPALWFGPAAGLNAKDIIPENWICI